MEDATLNILRLKSCARCIIRGGSTDLETLRQVEDSLQHYFDSLAATEEDNECFDMIKNIQSLRIQKQSENYSISDDSPTLQDENRPSAKSQSSMGRISVSKKESVAIMPELQSSDTSSAEKIHLLMLQQKDLTAQALEEERRSHVVLATEVANLTGVLKEATLMMNKSVLEQNIHLDSLQNVAADNQSELEKQSRRTNEQAKSMSISVWTSFSSIVWIVSMFVATYAVIRMFPRA